MEPVEDEPSSVASHHVKRPTKIRTERACVMGAVDDVAWAQGEDLSLSTAPPRKIEKPDKFGDRKLPLWQRQRP